MAGARKTLLVVDDSPVVLAVVKNAAEELLAGRVRVLTASDGMKGFIETRRSGLPDVILLDLNMVVYDGRSFLEMQANDPKIREVPVVLFSGSDVEALLTVQQEFPAVKAVLEKPLSPTVLFEALKKYLG